MLTPLSYVGVKVKVIQMQLYGEKREPKLCVPHCRCVKEDVLALDWSPDGSMLALGTVDNNFCLLDITKGKHPTPLPSIRGH